MNTIPEILRLLNNIVRIGSVEAVHVDATSVRARVAIGEIKTDWLPCATVRTGRAKSYSIPSVGEQVLVFAPGGDLGGAIVWGGLYSAENGPPTLEQNRHRMEFGDGTLFEYDENDKKMSVHAEGELNVYAAGDLTIEAAGKLTLKGTRVEINP